MAAIFDLYELKEHTSSWRERAAQFGDKRTRKSARSREVAGFEYNESHRVELHRVVAALWVSCEEESWDVYDDFDESEAEAVCSRCGCVGGPELFSLNQFYVSSPKCSACVKFLASHPPPPARPRVRKTLKPANPFPKTQKSKARKPNTVFVKTPGEENYHYKFTDLQHSDDFLELRAEFARNHAKTILANNIPIVSIRPAPISRSVAAEFVRLAHYSRKFSLAFHGTNVQNLESIFHRGLLPGGTHGIPRAHGAAYGTGVYLGRDALTSTSYCCAKTTMLVCALAEAHVGLVRDAGSIVVAHQGTVVPLFMLHYNYCHGYGFSFTPNSSDLMAPYMDFTPTPEPAPTPAPVPVPAPTSAPTAVTEAPLATAPPASDTATSVDAAPAPLASADVAATPSPSTTTTTATDLPANISAPASPTTALRCPLVVNTVAVHCETTTTPATPLPQLSSAPEDDEVFFDCSLTSPHVPASPSAVLA
eukprot:m.242339 g.242339  ORF g.242339 m.242339 type:complete len:479 (+) comp25538_c0_seq1:126-1562(+)